MLDRKTRAAVRAVNAQATAVLILKALPFGILLLLCFCGCVSWNASPDPITRFACRQLLERQRSLRECLQAAPSCVLNAHDIHEYRDTIPPQLDACYPKGWQP